MKNHIILKLFVALIGMLLISSCELIDPTDVENPAITEEKLFEDATGGAEPLITGLKYAFADAVARTVVFTETVSDNYVNTSTFISTQLDNPRNITPSDQYLGDEREIYFKLQTLHALASFGLETVLPADANSTDIDKSVVYFYKGMALLMLSENFIAFPIEEGGAAFLAEDAVKVAIADFEQALQIDPNGELAAPINLALARAYRLDKNKQMAVKHANDALLIDGSLLFTADYDAVNLINRFSLFIVLRSQEDLQPLPRLDFLDPKYASLDAADPIPVLKVEEAALILAEAAISDGNLEVAKSTLKSVVQTVQSRATVPFNDADPRQNRPTGSDIKVKFDPADDPIDGLVIDRAAGSVTTYPVSGTSLTDERIDAITSDVEFYRVLYLMRQEIFFSEGRRMSDLGIRLPVMQRQIDTNPNFSPGGLGSTIEVPAYIPPGNGLDAFTYDQASKTVTIDYDMNKILAENINIVSPF